MLKMFWHTEGGKLVARWKDVPRVPVNREKGHDACTLCKAPPEPEGARWWQWAVAVALFIAAFAPCNFL
jgi:hypothetical protein